MSQQGGRMVVIGAGVVGACVAYQLARGGAKVTVVDAGGVGGGTTNVTFSVDVSTRKTPRSYFELSRLAATEHIRLGRELGGAAWVHRAPIIEWATATRDRALLERRRRRLAAWGVHGERVDLAQATSVEPQLAPAQPDEIELIVYEGAWYQPRRLARTALAAAQRLGATLHENDPVIDIRRVGDRAERVRTATGRTWNPDAVIDCAGADADRVARLVGARLPVESVPGLVVTTSPSPNHRLRSIVLGARANARPAGRMRHVLHSYAVDTGLRPVSTREQLRTLGARVLAEVAAVLPGLGGARIERVASGRRPVPRDGFPLVGRVEDMDNFYAVVTHSGALLAPRLATLFGRELLDGSLAPELAHLRPTRVCDPAGSSDDDESTREMRRMLARPSQGVRGR